MVEWAWIRMMYGILLLVGALVASAVLGEDPPEHPVVRLTSAVAGSDDPVAQRAAELRVMDDPDCWQQDHYKYLQLPADQPRMYPDGSAFQYDCNSDYWGWYFDGSPADRWTSPRVPVLQLLFFDGDQAALPLSRSDLSPTWRHPRHADAVRWTDLDEGDTVCLHITAPRPNDPPVLRTYTIRRLMTLAYVVNTEARIETFPALTVEGDDMERSLEEWGVIPYSANGNWSRLYVTEGAC